LLLLVIFIQVLKLNLFLHFYNQYILEETSCGVVLDMVLAVQSQCQNHSAARPDCLATSCKASSTATAPTTSTTTTATLTTASDYPTGPHFPKESGISRRGTGVAHEKLL